MTTKVTLLLSTMLFERQLPNIYFGYHCARAPAISRQRQGFASLMQSAVISGLSRLRFSPRPLNIPMR